MTSASTSIHLITSFVGAVVETHSLKATELNGLSGEVIGDSVEKNGMTRIPVRVQLGNGKTQNMMFQPHNLHVKENPTPYHGNGTDPRLLLFEAVARGLNSVVEDLVKAGADVNCLNGAQCTPMSIAVEGDDIRMVMLLVHLGAHINVAIGKGYTPLCLACEDGSADMVRLLMKLGAKCMPMPADGCTPLFHAAKEGHVKAIEALAEYGADITTPSDNDVDPLHIAAFNGHVEAVKALCRLGASLRISSRGRTPMEAACQNGHIGVIRALVELGDDVQRIGRKSGCAPLHVASFMGHTEAIQALVKLGGNVHVRTVEDDTAIMLAARKGHTSAIKMLFNLGADIDASCCCGGSTAVVTAAAFGQVDAIKTLHKLGADMKPTATSNALKEAADTHDQLNCFQLLDRILAKMTNECASCGCSSRRLKLCSRCEKVRYCSVKCQKQDYKKHKKECISKLGAK